MTVDQFVLKYEQEKSLYLAWGRYVLSKIIANSKNTNFQIEPKVRVKEIQSLLAKAYYRGKNYSEPYRDITDKVGLRFVVLLSSEIIAINDIINNSTNGWNFSKDRDFEKERLDEPLAFDYQSMHYILTANSNIDFEGTVIPAGITCEIQIRTLLQHAYSELSHSRVYKPSFDPDAKVKRVVAKSMALLEATDEYFEEVNNKMNEIAAFALLDKLTNLLKSTMGKEFIISEKANFFIMDAFANEINNNMFSMIDLAALAPSVKANFTKTFLNSQPIIFILYFMMQKNKSLLIAKWPLTIKELRPIFTQLGIAINDLA